MRDTDTGTIAPITMEGGHAEWLCPSILHLGPSGHGLSAGVVVTVMPGERALSSEGLYVELFTMYLYFSE